MPRILLILFVPICLQASFHVGSNLVAGLGSNRVQRAHGRRFYLGGQTPRNTYKTWWIYLSSQTEARMVNDCEVGGETCGGKQRSRPLMGTKRSWFDATHRTKAKHLSWRGKFLYHGTSQAKRDSLSVPRYLPGEARQLERTPVPPGRSATA